MHDLYEIMELQNKENVIVNGKNLFEIHDVIDIKKKGLYKTVVPLSLQLSLLEKTFILCMPICSPWYI